MRKYLVACLALVLCFSMVGCTAETKMKANSIIEKQDKISAVSKEKAVNEVYNPTLPTVKHVGK